MDCNANDCVQEDMVRGRGRGVWAINMFLGRPALPPCGSRLAQRGFWAGVHVQGEQWKWMTLRTALLFPGVVFSIFFVLDLLVWSQKSSGAVPFGTLFALCFLWFGISVPLVFIGSYLGFKKQAQEDPLRTNKIPRQVPDQVLLDTSPVMCMAALSHETGIHGDGVAQRIVPKICSTSQVGHDCERLRVSWLRQGEDNGWDSALTH